jgi:hypothetical protein
MVEEPKKEQRWWQTIPGVVTALAGMITAITGLIVALNAAGLFGGKAASSSSVNISKKSSAPSESAIMVPESIPQPSINSSPAASVDQGASIVTNSNVSTNIDKPTWLSSNEIRGIGIGEGDSYYYTFHAGPGIIKITADAKNKPSGFAIAIHVVLMDINANKLADLSIGNTSIDQRVVKEMSLNHEQQLIMRVILDEETIDYMIKIEGAATFAPMGLPDEQ